MTDSKSFASLSSSLLARRGQAKPAMRPQAIQLVQGNVNPLEDLGWNDMGHDQEHPVQAAPVAPIHPDIEPEAPAVTPAVVDQQVELARVIAQPAPVELVQAKPVPQTPSVSGRVRAAAGSKGKAAFTLRLDPERHLQLRLICAVEHKSAQQIVTRALDEFLSRQASDQSPLLAGNRVFKN